MEKGKGALLDEVVTDVERGEEALLDEVVLMMGKGVGALLHAIVTGGDREKVHFG